MLSPSAAPQLGVASYLPLRYARPTLLAQPRPNFARHGGHTVPPRPLLFASRRHTLLPVAPTQQRRRIATVARGMDACRARRMAIFLARAWFLLVQKAAVLSDACRKGIVRERQANVNFSHTHANVHLIHGAGSLDQNRSTVSAKPSAAIRSCGGLQTNESWRRAVRSACSSAKRSRRQPVKMVDYYP